MKQEFPLYSDYMLATLIGALIFAAGYFVRDFNSFIPTYDTLDSSITATLPAPPETPPPPPPPLVLEAMEEYSDVAAVEETMDY